MKKPPYIPPVVIRLAVNNAISKRTNDLIRQAAKEGMSHQSYLAQKFPADAISYLDDAISEAIEDYEKLYDRVWGHVDAD